MLRRNKEGKKEARASFFVGVKSREQRHGSNAETKK